MGHTELTIDSDGLGEVFLPGVQDDYAALEAVQNAELKACRAGNEKLHAAFCRAYVTCKMSIDNIVQKVVQRGGLMLIVHPMKRIKRRAVTV